MQSHSEQCLYESSNSLSDPGAGGDQATGANHPDRGCFNLKSEISTSGDSDPSLNSQDKFFDFSHCLQSHQVSGSTAEPRPTQRRPTFHGM